MEYLDSWLRPLRDVRAAHEPEIEALKGDEAAKVQKLSELKCVFPIKISNHSVVEQVKSIKRLSFVRKAIEERHLWVWGFMYHVDVGQLRALPFWDDPAEKVYQLNERDH